jgi:hypothetical protein
MTHFWRGGYAGRLGELSQRSHVAWWHRYEQKKLDKKSPRGE